MTRSNTAPSGGIGLLFLLFLALKLTGVIDWSWWWITAPLWIPTAIFVTAVAVVGLVAAIRSK